MCSHLDIYPLIYVYIHRIICMHTNKYIDGLPCKIFTYFCYTFVSGVRQFVVHTHTHTHTHTYIYIYLYIYILIWKPIFLFSKDITPFLGNNNQIPVWNIPAWIERSNKEKKSIKEVKYTQNPRIFIELGIKSLRSFGKSARCSTHFTIFVLLCIYVFFFHPKCFSSFISPFQLDRTVFSISRGTSVQTSWN